jgi:predicted porin
MQKKIIAVAVAGLSTAAFAQTNVTIYGVADVSAQGYTMSQSKALNAAGLQSPASGSVFSVQSNSSLIGFKGTEDLGNGLKALFQAETTLNMTGSGSTNSGGGLAVNTGNSVFSGMRDTFVGLNSKYGTGMAGYMSTPFRQSLTSFDVMPGATGSGQIERMMGGMRLSQQALGDGAANSVIQGGYAVDSSVRLTAIAYAMPTLYGFDGSIAYSGSNNNGGSNNSTLNESSGVSANSQTPVGAFSFNLGWTGYGVNIKGAFSQQKLNLVDTTPNATSATPAALSGYTSYLVGAMYTGLPGLKAGVVYNRNSLGINATGTDNGANKLSNNQVWTGVSYRMGNWEPRISAVWSSDYNGVDGGGPQLGSRQWTFNTGYYLSKRTQVYGVIANLNNSANQNYSFGQQSNRLQPTGGQNLFTYGMGMRTTF